MKVLLNRLRQLARGKARRSVRPSIEGLEDRFLLYSTTGGKFAYGSRITYSFVPDGTYLGGPTSNLFSSMDARIARSSWQAAFTYAAATWSAVANINLVQVGDIGAPMGAFGYQQGDPNVGDIRIGGFVMGNTTMATTFSPPPQNGGTLAGDMLFNTGLLWQINHDYDLQTVAIHEFGHALGLDHSSVAGADMNAVYTGLKQTLTTDDVYGIQAVWGPRAPDWSSQGAGNFTPSSATNPMQFLDGNNQITLYDLNITSSTDQHWYKVVTPPNASTTLTTVIQSANLSMLSPKVQIYSASLAGLSQASAPYSFGTYVGASITNATPNTTYYIRTSAANSGLSGTGSYALFVNMGYAGLTPVNPPYTTVAWQPDQGGGALNLGGDTTNGNRKPSGKVKNGTDESPEVINIGTLTGPGCELKMSPNLVKPGRTDVSKIDVAPQTFRYIPLTSLTGFEDELEKLLESDGAIRPVVGARHPRAAGESSPGRSWIGSIREKTTVYA